MKTNRFDHDHFLNGVLKWLHLVYTYGRWEMTQYSSPAETKKHILQVQLLT